MRSLVPRGVRTWRLTGMIALLSALQALGLLLFCRGFLLSRVGVQLVSTRNEPVASAHFAHEPAAAAFDRVVVLIVDALRLDFLIEQPYSTPGAPHVAAMTQTLELAESLVRARNFMCREADSPGLHQAIDNSSPHACSFAAPRSFAAPASLPPLGL